MTEVAQVVDAGQAAIEAAVRVAGPGIAINELIGAMLALVVANLERRPPEEVAETKEVIAHNLMIDIINLVGIRRAGELVGIVSSQGVDRNFS